MRNKYPGTCYRCFKPVKVGEGHYERYKRGWIVQHAKCAIEHRGTNQGSRESVDNFNKLLFS